MGGTARYASFHRLEFDRPAPSVLRIVLSTPGKLNAVDRDMHRELASVWAAIDDDPDVGAVVVMGAGEHFSSGGDLTMVEEIADDFDARATVLAEARDLVYNIVNFSKPLVSAMRGVAVGAGLAVALLADVSVAGRSARIIDGHTRLGVPAGDHAVMIWPLLCGLAKAKYHLLLGVPVDGAEAERLGLVSLCVDDEDVEARSLELAEQLSQGSSSSIRWTKYALNNWLRQAGPVFDASLALEFIGFSGPDVREGLASLRERRAPRFSAPSA